MGITICLAGENGESPKDGGSNLINYSYEIENLCAFGAGYSFKLEHGQFSGLSGSIGIWNDGNSSISTGGGYNYQNELV